jgi:esterase/lipase superfamily enzyme
MKDEAQTAPHEEEATAATSQPEDEDQPPPDEVVEKTDSPRAAPEETLQQNPERQPSRHRAAKDEPPRMAYSMAPERTEETPEGAAAEVEGQHPGRPDTPETNEGDREAYTMKTVFYATDRKAQDDQPPSPLAHWGLLPAGVSAVVTLVLLGVGVCGSHRTTMFSLALLTLLMTILLGSVWGYDQFVDFRRYAKPEVEYGNDRGDLELGTCQVSIPWSHTVGELEAPSILRLEIREDVDKHVVLHETRRERDEVFYRKLRQTVREADRPEVFVFVHGYNVTFEGAARRTAQIAHDVDFSGAAVFFSWPSQGGLLQYTVDETNVVWAVPHLKQFLLDVVQESGAKSISLVAHSMGSRGLSRALYELSLEMREQEALFNQIVLAAPDIDAEVFRRDLAPALTRTSQRVTVYASSNDQALAASKKVHGHARAGDSGSGLVVLRGVETIDVSTIKTSLLGHSYYGSSNPVLRDLRQLILEGLSAHQRSWLTPMPHNGLTYWVFQHARDTAAGDSSIR